MRSQIILLAMGALYCSACSSRAGLHRPVLAGSHQPAGARIALNLHTSAARAAHPVLVEKTRVASRRASIGALGAMLAAGDGARPVLAGDPPWPYSTLIDEIGNGFVSSVQISAEAKQALVVDKTGKRHMTQLMDAADLVDRLRAAGVPFEVVPEPRDLLSLGRVANVLGAFLPTIVLLGGLYLLLLQASDEAERGRGSPLRFAKSRDVNLEPATGVTFADVAGCDPSKQELEEVVDFLKRPMKYAAVGAKIPRGVLMEGAPGTGKTLLARAVAGEAGVPFLAASGSEFVEMFVGVGASRVRDLFRKAQKNAPCILFIDEIDAVGRTRPGTGGTGGSDEREQTLNQILTEMDGFDTNAGVIVIAATNRPDILDPALLRPGRFDRRIPVDLPDRSGREQILKVHARDKPLAPDVSLRDIAVRTTGMSGASLRNVLNEAAIVAARRNLVAIGSDEVDYAIDRIRMGLQRAKETGPIGSTQRLVAYHEAGHAVMALLTPEFDAVSKVSIIPRSSGLGGFTLFTPTDEQLESGLYTKRYLLDQIAVALGGYVGEEIVYGEDEVTTSASDDLQKERRPSRCMRVQRIAHRMVSQWGFTANRSADPDFMVGWEAPDAGPFSTRTMSPDTESLIDQRTKDIVDGAYALCKATLIHHRPLLDALADELVHKETVTHAELLELLEAVERTGPGRLHTLANGMSEPPHTTHG